MRELQDLRSLERVDTALESSRAVRASVSRMIVGVGVDEEDDDAACCCVLMSSAVLVADSADLSVSSFFLLPNCQAVQ